MREEQLNICFLYIEMILAAPGAKLHKCFRNLRKNTAFSAAILMGIVLFPAGIILWQFRGTDTLLLILAGIGLVTVFSFLFSLLRKHSDTVLAFGEMITYPFHNSYEQCREMLDKLKTESFRNENTKEDTQDNPAMKNGSAENEYFSGYDDTDRKKNREKSENTASNNGNEQKKDSDHHRRHYRTSPANARLDEAKAFFGVDIPFTADEIKQRRNQLLKKYHPDNPDGSEEMCKKINECYALLIRYAA